MSTLRLAVGMVLFALAAQAQPGGAPSNFIDEEIQAAWKRVTWSRVNGEGANVKPAPPSTDAEYLRRVYLDLTGRIPTAGEVRSFLASSSSSKRAETVDRLLGSEWFSDRWAQWFADLGRVSHNVQRGYTGRNAFYNWIRNAVRGRMPLSDLAAGMVASQGNNYDEAVGAVNFTLVQIPSGPPQDLADAIFARTASTFLGMGHYDCLLCHDGRGHMDSLSLWGSRSSRLDAWRMAAFFTRIGYQRVNTSNSYFDSNVVSDSNSGEYRLNTVYGNRPARAPIGGVATVQPAYGAMHDAPKTENWRREFAQRMVRDPMFARNFANRLWLHMMGTALVEPVDALDPDRLDPAKPPPAPWKLQASHPRLLEKLAARLVETNFDLRGFLRLITQSSAYQLSSGYNGDARSEGDRLYVRHRARRMEAEAIHDAVAIATGVSPGYRIRTTAGYLPERLHWANQFPGPMSGDEMEPPEAEFFEAFFPGDRNLQPRSEAGSTRQQLYLMNSAFVNSRLRVETSPVLRRVASLKKNEDVAAELFLTFLSRPPETLELATAVESLRKAGRKKRSEAIEDLAWACINKPEFIVNP